MSKKTKATAETNTGKHALVPKLRFPDFRDAPEWQEKPLKRICEINPTGAVLAERFIYIDLESVEDGSLISKKEISRDEAPSRAQRLIKSGDVIYQVVRPYQKNNLFCEFEDDFTYVASTGYAQLRANGSSRFLYHLVHTDPFVSSVIKKCTGSNYPAINSSDLSEIVSLTPQVDEQQKIADCLSSLDDLITAQTQKVEALKTHKIGLMQRLFPAEGETVPKLRFSEFRKAQEWENKKLGQVAEYENGKAHEQDIAESGKFVVVNSKFISTEGGVRKFTNSDICIADRNDILMVLSDIPNGRALAKCFIVDSDNLYAVNQRICRLKPYKADSIFLFHVLNRNSYFLAFDDGVKQTNLKKDDVLDCPILLPKDIKEQQKIADCLSSIGGLIAAQLKKVEVLKAHKKGLMQQLFPALKETAK